MDPNEPSDRPTPPAGDPTPGRDRAGAGHARPGKSRWERAEEILAAVNGRWTVPILRHIASGESRPTDLLNAINAARAAG